MKILRELTQIYIAWDLCVRVVEFGDTKVKASPVNFLSDILVALNLIQMLKCIEYFSLGLILRIYVVE